MKDREILDRIKSSDESAIHYLYDKYYRMMVKMVLKNNGTEEEARDVYQDALIVFWEKVVSDKLTLTAKISTYLYSICNNLWLKELDRKRRLSHEEKDGEYHPEHDQNERIQIIHDCIDSLGDTCKKVLTYYYFDRLSMQDIADKLNFGSADTAKTKKYKCKKELDNIVKSRYKVTDFID